jgi:hypothetical protein
MTAKKVGKKTAEKVIDHIRAQKRDGHAIDYADVEAAVNDVVPAAPVDEMAMVAAASDRRRVVELEAEVRRLNDLIGLALMAETKEASSVDSEVARLHDAIKLHRSLCHRMGTRQCDSQLHRVLEK